MVSGRQFKSGNTVKAHSYAAAWKQIERAIKGGFFIEAISIQESIICDRLLNHLHTQHRFPLRNDRTQHHSLHALIHGIGQAHPGCDVDGLFSKLNVWRQARNDAIHTLVRSDPGSPTTPVTQFFAMAEYAANEGKKLARNVDKWCRHVAKRAPKPELKINPKKTYQKHVR